MKPQRGLQAQLHVYGAENGHWIQLRLMIQNLSAENTFWKTFKTAKIFSCLSRDPD